MKSSVRFRRGRAIYTGRLSRASFAVWLQTSEARPVVAAASARVRVSFFGKKRIAERRIWRAVSRAARDADIAAIVQREVDQHLARVGTYAYADGLPRLPIELHRLVVVPRVLVNAALFASLSRTLIRRPAFSALEHPLPLAEFVAVAVVDDVDRAIARIAPSPAQPVPAGADWITVGSNDAFVWRGPSLKEPPWPGHHYVFEVMRDPITRRIRKALADGIRQMEVSLPSLTQLQRADILRRAHRA